MTIGKPYLIEISGDLFDIASRLKEIDERYFPVYNKKYGRFEIHCAEDGRSLACVLPFDRLDGRTIEYVRETRVENVERLFGEIEKNNEKITNSREAVIEDEMKKKTADLVKHLERGGKDVPEYGEI
jgi:ribosomal protein S1